MATLKRYASTETPRLHCPRDMARTAFQVDICLGVRNRGLSSSEPTHFDVDIYL
jgi:hypothetical protein